MSTPTKTPHKAALAAAYVLSRHVPALASGFSICTNYGEERIHADEVARHPALTRTIERIFTARLEAAEGGQGVQS